jgi:hypothetical protein
MPTTLDWMVPYEADAADAGTVVDSVAWLPGMAAGVGSPLRCRRYMVKRSLCMVPFIRSYIASITLPSSSCQAGARRATSVLNVHAARRSQPGAFGTEQTGEWLPKHIGTTV